MKAVFIDIDNTLLSFDGYVKKSMEEGFRVFGLRTYEPWMYDIFKEENDRLWCMIETGEIDFDELKRIRWNIIFKRLGINADGPVFETYFRRRLNESAIPEPGAPEMLRDLKCDTDLILAAASNGPYDQQVHRIALAGMDRFLDYIFISEKIGYSKPAVEFFDSAFNEINEGRSEKILPCECVMIGDSLTSDMAGGRNAGMHTCFYRRDPGMKITEDVDAVVDDLKYVTRELKNINMIAEN